MVYNEPENIRKIGNLTASQAPNNLLEDFINKADRSLINSITVQVRNEEMVNDINRTESQVIDGNNKVFYTQHFPLADTNSSYTLINNEIKWVWTDDIKVYTWGTKYDESTKSEVTIININDKTGMVELETAPSSDSIAWITCDYYHYYNEMDFEIIKEVAAIGALLRWARREYFWHPDSIRIGPLDVKYIPRSSKLGSIEGGLPTTRIYQAYIHGLNLLKKKAFAKTDDKTITRIKRMEEKESDIPT